MASTSSDFILGPFSEQENITPRSLQSFTQHSLKEIPIGLVQEIRDFCNSDLQCAEHLINISTVKEVINIESLRRKIKSTSDKIKKLKKNKSKELSNYLSKTFAFPISLETKAQNEATQLDQDKQALAQKIISKTNAVVQENRYLKRKLKETTETLESLENKYITLENCFSEVVRKSNEMVKEYDEGLVEKKLTMEEMKKRNKELQKLCDNKSTEMDELLLKLGETEEKLSKYKSRNVTKRMKRRDEKISVLERKLQECQNENENLQNENEGLLSDKNDIMNEICQEKEKVDALKMQKIALQKKMHKLKCKVDGLNEKNVQTNEKESDEMNDELRELRNRVSELEDLNVFLDGNEIKTFENGRYTNEVRECCMDLMTTGNVSLNKIPIVIRSVLSRLAGKIPEKLPSKALLSSRIMAEAKLVACKQVSEAMLKDFDPKSMSGNVLHQDATTKFHNHYEGIQVTLKDGRNMSMGLSQVGGGDAASYTECFSNCIQDLAMAYREGKETEEIRGKLIASIKSLMSDQCATNSVFNANIEQMRKDILPTVVENFEDLSDVEKKELQEMGKFACRLHLIANFGEAANKAMKMFEDSITEGRNPHSFDSEESGTFRLARTAAKALTRRGSDKAGIASFWDVYLKGKSKKNHLITFHGHRINIAFHDCAAVYYHQTDIQDMLKDWPEPNKLLQSVLFDVNEKVFLAGTRAMGIFDKLVTAPLWNILESEGSILDVNDHLLQMKQVLQHWTNDGSEPLSGSRMFPETTTSVKMDELYDLLFQPTNDPEIDSYTQIALELLSAQLLLILERQAQTQLPGGKYWDPNEKTKEMAKNVPKTNAISERDMAILDNMLRAKPSASTLTIESVLLWSRNDTSEWLETLSSDEKNKMLDHAQKQAASYMETFKVRQLKVQEKIANKLKEKKEKKEKVEQKKMNDKICVTREISKYGGLWSCNDMEDKIQRLCDETESERAKEKVMRDALLSQIKFHKSVLHSQGARELFQESAKKVKYTNAQLKSNLKEILSLNEVQVQGVSESRKLVYKSREEIDEALDLKKQSVFSKLQSERTKRQVKQNQEQLPVFLQNPELLVGRKIMHKCQENGVIDWFAARITRIKSVKDDAIKSEFYVEYDESPEDEWFFPLLIDLKKGDLMLLE